MISWIQANAHSFTELLGMACPSAVSLTGIVKACELGPPRENATKQPCKLTIKILRCNTAQPDGFAVPLYKIRVNAAGQAICKKAINTLHGEWTPSLSFVLNVVLKTADELVPVVGDRVRVENLVASFDKKAGKRFSCDKLIVEKPGRERSPVRPVADPPAERPAEEHRQAPSAANVSLDVVLALRPQEITLREAKEVLRQWGVPEAELRRMSRWPAIWKIKQIAQTKVANGETNPHLVRLAKARLSRRRRPDAAPASPVLVVDDDGEDDDNDELPPNLLEVDPKKVYLPEAVFILRQWGVPSDALTNLSRPVALQLVQSRARQLREEGSTDPMVLKWADAQGLPGLDEAS